MIDKCADIAMNTMLFALLCLVISCPVLIYFDGKKEERLLKQCLDHGRKEYECVYMLRQRSPGVVPVIVPVR